MGARALIGVRWFGERPEPGTLVGMRVERDGRSVVLVEPGPRVPEVVVRSEDPVEWTLRFWARPSNDLIGIPW
jgi:hypothetical protein